MNYIPPYRVSLFEAFQEQIEQLSIFISVNMEKNRTWPIEWGALRVIVQKTITIPVKWKHPNGFSETIFVHFPLDTIFQLARYKPDVVVSVEFGFRTLQSILYKLIFKESKLIIWAAISEQTEKGRGKVREILRRWMLKFTDGVWVNGKSGAKYIRRLGVSEEKIFCVPYTIDHKKFLHQGSNSAYSSKNTYRLLIISQLIDRKGLLPFINILSGWAENNIGTNVEVCIIGEGQLYETIKNKKVPSNLSVQLIGNVPYHDLPSYYHQAHLFAFPTLADEWGVVVNEAMAAGLPIIGSLYSQAVEELVVNESNGWSFYPDDEQQTLLVLDKAFSNSFEELKVMGKLAQMYVENFGVEYAVTQMINSLRFVRSTHN